MIGCLEIQANGVDWLKKNSRLVIRAFVFLTVALNEEFVPQTPDCFYAFSCISDTNGRVFVRDPRFAGPTIIRKQNFVSTTGELANCSVNAIPSPIPAPFQPRWFNKQANGHADTSQMRGRE